LHPMAPFITEELFQKLKERFAKEGATSHESYCKETLEALSAVSISLASYPIFRKSDEKAEEEFAIAEEMVRTIRNIRAEMKIPPQTPSDVYIKGGDASRYLPMIRALVRTKEVTLVDELPEIGLSASGSVKEFAITLPLPEELAEKEKARLEKESVKLEQQCLQVEKLLNNPAFIEKAAPELVENKKASLEETRRSLTRLKEQLALLEG